MADFKCPYCGENRTVFSFKPGDDFSIQLMLDEYVLHLTVGHELDPSIVGGAKAAANALVHNCMAVECPLCVEGSKVKIFYTPDVYGAYAQALSQLMDHLEDAHGKGLVESSRIVGKVTPVKA